MKQSFRILIVEDDRTSIELVKEALNEDTHLAYSLTLASDGDEALRILRGNSEKPNMILLDLNLPKKSGFEVLKEIKQDPHLRVIPVIILTNSRSHDDVMKAYAHYCNAYVRKPLGFEKLVAMIKATSTFWFEAVTLPDLDRPMQPPIALKAGQSWTRYSKPTNNR